MENRYPMKKFKVCKYLQKAYLTVKLSQMFASYIHALSITW